MLITDEYRKQNAALHESNPNFGVSGKAWAPKVRELAAWGRKAVLDFGCGKATLAHRLGPAYQVTDYDPCIEGLDATPTPHPVVVCGDVLEHVEPECFDDVLAELRRVTQEVGLFVVHLTAAKKTLPDGRNAHLIQQPTDWWAARIHEAGFAIQGQGGGEHEAWFIVGPAQ